MAPEYLAGGRPLSWTWYAVVLPKASADDVTSTAPEPAREDGAQLATNRNPTPRVRMTATVRDTFPKPCPLCTSTPFTSRSTTPWWCQEPAGPSGPPNCSVEP